MNSVKIHKVALSSLIHVNKSAHSLEIAIGPRSDDHDAGRGRAVSSLRCRAPAAAGGTDEMPGAVTAAGIIVSPGITAL